MIGSDLVIVLAIGMHLFEAAVFAVTPAANGSIGNGTALTAGDVYNLTYTQNGDN